IEYFRGTGVIVRFIEFMDVGTRNDWRMENVVPSRELLNMLDARWPLHPVDPNYRGEVARRYAFADGGGEVGFISSVTAPFCGNCSRARLSSDGKLFTCLFANSGLDLRERLRSGQSDEELLARLRAAWGQRDDRYSELRNRPGHEQQEKVEMFYIGG